jgi:hypothetical protein
MDWQQVVPYLIPILAVAVVAARAWRAQKPQPVKPSRLWIRPVVLAVFLVLALSTAPMPDLVGIALFAGAGVAGLGAGYLRALHQEFSIDPETGAVMSKATPLGSALFGVVLVLRFMLKTWMNGGVQTQVTTVAKGAHLLLYSDAMLIFLIAMVGASAWEVWRRTRPLIAAHKAAKAALPPGEGGVQA